jgi:acyl-CoA dehydrogenase
MLLMFLPLVGALLVSLAAAYGNMRLRTWVWATAIAILAVGGLAQVPGAAGVTLLIFGLIAVPLIVPAWRRAWLSAPALRAFEGALPRLSVTERTALEAGTVGFEGDLFSGRPDWSRLREVPAVHLTAEEQAFLDGPCETLCGMLNDWEITHERADLPPEVWDFLKVHRFFGMIIPKAYGGLAFSALAQAAVLQKIATVSAVAASTVGVPNSLGPGELLLHYGTEAQKAHYLPRLADGRDIPCFALTGPTAGSDATSIPDIGVVCEGEWQGQRVLGVRLTFDKRYITLAPVATLVGLAFRLQDPAHLLGDLVDVGITLALIERNTPGLTIGRRHFPLNIPFQNGPLSGQDVFVPIEALIGGPAMAGQGWRMLVECLSVGRAITLPANAASAAKIGMLTTGAYARVRHQFGVPIGQFQGIEEALARIGGRTYMVAALARATASAVARGEKPAVAGAIAKYHTTEMARSIAQDVMDVHGGKGVQLGPNNYAGRAWQGAPIAITVEGANIMTRCLMIFGQGAIRCHPYVLKEMAAVALPDPKERLQAFDDLFWRHVGLTVGNAVRALTMGLTGARFGKGPGTAVTAPLYRHLTRYSAALGLTADLAMLVLGGKLKFMERISARLGDVLADLYIGSALLKRFEDQGCPEDEHPFLLWAFDELRLRIETAFEGILRNFPARGVAAVLRGLVLPWGRTALGPSDHQGHAVATALLALNPACWRIAEWTHRTPSPHHPAGRLLAAFPGIIAAEILEGKLARALKQGTLDSGLTPAAVLQQAVEQGLLTVEDAAQVTAARAAAHPFIAVDDFDPADLPAGRPRSVPLY